MVRILVDKMHTNEKCYIEVSCLSTDTKPVGNFVTGSILNEVDTGKVYFYNEEANSGAEWVEQFSFQE